METETSTGLQAWLKARTESICMAFNRLMNFHVVRSTKAITFSPLVFVADPAYRHIREP